MKRTALFIVLGLSLSLIWATRSAVCGMPVSEVLGKEVDGIHVSIRLTKTLFVSGDLKVCTDPNQPTNKLMWKSVKEFYPGID